jgi:glycosyltransferase involved in cell wall biosynthesis
MPSLSATIITLNEAANIERAVRSLGPADEIVVVDSGSTDGTVEIARRLGATVIENPWEGFAAQKNLAAAKAGHDWILSLDADEELNADAQQAVRDWKQSSPKAAAYCFARRARYLGRWILHSGWYPDWKTRLYDRRRARFDGAYVHETVKAAGPVERLGGEILHYTCDSLADHQKRIEFYTHLAAREMLAKGERAGALRRLAMPPWLFLNTYFLRLGLLDGVQGFHIARMAARYVRMKYAKAEGLWAARKEAP